MVDIIFRTNDGAKWGAGKGADLDPVEVDGNFWNLKQKVEELDGASGSEGVGILSIAVIGDQLTFTMTDLTTRGPFTIPVAAFDWTAGFQGNHEYEAFDIFVADGGMYLVRYAHTSASTFDPASTGVSGLHYALIFPYPTTYQFGFFYPGQPGKGIDPAEMIFGHTLARPVILPADLVGSVATVQVAFDDDVSFPIYQNGDVIGSLDFAASATVGTFTFATQTQFDPLDTFYIGNLAEVNAQARALAVTIVGVLGEES